MIDPSIYRQLSDLEERLARLETVERPTFIGARYTIGAGQTLINNTAAIINYDVLSYDPLGLVTTGAGWVFTCPIDGYYRVTAALLLDTSAGWAGTEPARLDFWRAGALYSYPYRADNYVSGSYAHPKGSDVIACSAGQALQVLAIQVSGGNIATYAAADAGRYSYVAIERVG